MGLFQGKSLFEGKPVRYSFDEKDHPRNAEGEFTDKGTSGESNSLERLKPAKHFTDMNKEEARIRLSELLTALGSRDVLDALQAPTGKYVSDLRIHDKPSADRVSEHEKTSELARKFRAEVEDMRMRIKFIEQQEKNKKKK